jgi:hypothetical protein
VRLGGFQSQASQSFSKFFPISSNPCIIGITEQGLTEQVLNYPQVLVLQFHTGFNPFIQYCINNSYALKERVNFDWNGVYIEHEHLRHSISIQYIIHCLLSLPERGKSTSGQNSNPYMYMLQYSTCTPNR